MSATVAQTVVTIAIAILLAAGVTGYLYVPFRKRVMIAFDRSWRKRAQIPEFSQAAQDAEQGNLFVSATVIRDACDIVWHAHQKQPPAALLGPLQHGTSVHVNARKVSDFIKDVLPRLQAPVVLVSGCETVDTNVPDYEKIIESDKILCWFLQNFELDEKYANSGRVVKLPVGLNYHKLDPSDPENAPDTGLPATPAVQQLTLKSVREALPALLERPLAVYANFHLNMDTFLRSPEGLKRKRARRQAIEELRLKSFITWEPRQIPRNEVWRRHADYSFEISPHGNGLDCHRTWEAILLGTIPIVKTSSLDSLYDGLPVVIVENWLDVTEDNLRKWRTGLAPLFDGPIPEPLFSNYWLDRIHGYKRTSDVA